MIEVQVSEEPTEPRFPALYKSNLSGDILLISRESGIEGNATIIQSIHLARIGMITFCNIIVGDYVRLPTNTIISLFNKN